MENCDTLMILDSLEHGPQKESYSDSICMMIDCHHVPQRTAAKNSIKSTSIEGQCKITCDLQSRVKIIKVIKSRSACKHELSSHK